MRDPLRRRPGRSSAPVRSAQTPSCSPAAARKVSPAARTTERPVCQLAMRELADRRRLADAVHADEEPHRGRVLADGERESSPSKSARIAAFKGQAARRCRRPRTRAPSAGGSSRASRRRQADVGEDQRLLELVEELRRRPDPARERPPKVAASSLTGAAEPVAEARWRLRLLAREPAPRQRGPPYRSRSDRQLLRGRRLMARRRRRSTAVGRCSGAWRERSARSRCCDP